MFIEPKKSTQTEMHLIAQIKEAKTDLHVLALLMEIYPAGEMAVLFAALTRVQELILLQKEKK